MIFEKLLQGQPEGIFGIGYNDPSTVGIICTVILLILVICGVRVVIAASIAGMIGLVELIGYLRLAINVNAEPIYVPIIKTAEELANEEIKSIRE